MQNERINKQDAIQEDLRTQIVTRRLLPGTLVPSREVLAQRFSTSKSVVQRALATLVQDGLVLSRGAGGTYVCERLPYLTRYGVIFEWRPSDDMPWSQFWKTLQHEALVLHTPGIREFRTYFARDGQGRHGISKTLLDDVKAHRIAGMIFTGPPFALQASQALQEPAMPRVGIMGLPYQQIPAVRPDSHSFVSRAMDYLAGRDRRRVAVVAAASDWQPWDEEHTLREAAARGMTIDPAGIQTCHFGNTRAAASIVRLLMRLPAAERPDALIVADDNLVAPAVAGLLATDVRIPEELDVVAHCNFPLPTADVLPIRRLGFDCRGLLLKCVEIIGAQRRGEPVPEQVPIPAVWADELQTPPTAGRESIPQDGRFFVEVGAD